MRNLIFTCLMCIGIAAFAQWDETQSGKVTTSDNVGIGTSTPDAKVEIHNTASTGHLILSANDNPLADRTRIDIDFNISNRGHTVSRVASYYSTSVNGGSGGLRFYSRNAGLLDERMRITDNGNIGIGTISPTAKLEVRGVLKSSIDQNRAISVFTSGDGNAYVNYQGGDSNSRIGFQIDGGSAMSILNNRSVSIGTISTGSHKLAVDGSIGAREVKVEASGWSDHVFHDGYKLMALDEVGKFISDNHHLPNIPTEAEVLEDGINLGEMNARLLEKIEELTLYIIKQNDEIQELKKRMDTYEKN